MRHKSVSTKNILIVGVLLLLAPFLNNRVLAYTFTGWHHGGYGYVDAYDEAVHTENPLILYFHIESCKWCQKMNNVYISANKVRWFCKDIPKVEINPDKGPAEKALTKKYNITGYPSFLVLIPALNGEAKRIYPFRKGRDWTVDEFIQAITKKVVHQYHQGAYSCYQREDYEDALKYLDGALHFDNNNAYSYFLKGRIKYRVGHRDNNIVLLEEAEANYLKALEIDPDDQRASKDLERLHKLMEYIGIR